MRWGWTLGLLWLAGCAGTSAAGPATVADATSEVVYGKGIAERSCGGCHAVAHGPSPMPAAPAFADLHRRYPAGGLRRLLEEGMILPSDRMQEEGSRYTHPRMPATPLGDDEIQALTAYLHSLEPARAGSES